MDIAEVNYRPRPVTYGKQDLPKFAMQYKADKRLQTQQYRHNGAEQQT